MEHFKDVFEIAHVDGALAASVFHTAAIDIGELSDTWRRPASRSGRV